MAEDTNQMVLELNTEKENSEENKTTEEKNIEAETKEEEENTENSNTEEEPVDENTGIIDELAKKEFSSLDSSKYQENTNTASDDVGICILSKNPEIIETITETIETANHKLLEVSSDGEEFLKKIDELNPQLIFIGLELDGKLDGVKTGEKISERNIPLVYIFKDSADIESNKFLITNYGFIFEFFKPEEIKFTMEIALKKHKTDITHVSKVETRFQEKNIELGIEKLYSTLLLILSIFLIVAGLISRNVTFMQWIVFIPAVLMLTLGIVSLFKQREVIPYEEPPFVSAIIPAHNEEYTIETTVRSIGAMEYNDNEGNRNYEIIVVNDGSTDRTGEILAGLKGEIENLRIITRKPPKSGKGKGFVLNDALVLAHGEIVGVFDADTQVKQDYLQTLIPYLNHKKVVGVQSRVKMYNKDHNFLTNMQEVEFSGFANVLRAKDTIGFNGFLGGNGQFVKKEAIQSAGKWDGFAVTEDLNLSIKILLNGQGIRFCPEVAVYQEAVTEWRPFMRQRVRWAIGNFETLFVYAPKIIMGDIDIVEKIGILSHVSLYAFNLFIFIGFIIFIVNVLAWFVFGVPTVIRMEAPIEIGIVSATAFFPGTAISLFRDDKRYLQFLKDLIYYWLYCFHLIPLFFKTLANMISRKERTWAKTTHKGATDD